jgi:hypothetical protein
MADNYGEPAPDRRIITRMRNGTQEVISTDVSLFREGSGSTIPLTSPLAVLCGNQLVMKYWMHNCHVNENGTINVKDDAGGAGLIAYCEDDTVRYFGAPATTNSSQPAVFTLYKTYNMLTGAETWVGPITPSQTVGIVGTNAVNNAQAGSVGEMGPASTNSAPALTTATPANLGNISLTAGDWDVWGVALFSPATTTTMTVHTAGINTTSATLPAAGQYATLAGFTITGAVNVYMNVPTVRVNVSTTTTVYLVGQATFATSTCAGGGFLFARRRR